MDYQPRSGLRPEKKQRDRLIRLAATDPTWALGFADEVWWSRLAQPNLHSWAPVGGDLRWVQKTVAKADPDPKALACYGLLIRPTPPTPEQVWLRFATGQPVSGMTIPFLTWCADQVAALGQQALLLIWDNASWHTSQAVRAWLRVHNRTLSRPGRASGFWSVGYPAKVPGSIRLNPSGCMANGPCWNRSSC